MPDADRRDLELIVDAARDAAEIARGFFNGSAESWTKEDDSPVTEADIAVDRMLCARLREARPAYGWLSEEREDDPARLDCERVFVVDPIDGTRAFMARESGWVISVGIVEDGTPRVGVLVAPVTGETWTAVLGDGARRDGKAISPGARHDLRGAHIAGSKRMVREIGLEEADEVTRTYDKSLARRLALVGAGGYDAAIASANARDWDLAAAALIVTEAGGKLTDFEGRALRFNRADPRHPPLVAASPRLHSALLDRHRSLTT